MSDEKNEKETFLSDSSCSVCPACYEVLDFWACEALCHTCGVKFTCDQ
mgnify:CR=1 FL=1